MKSNEKFQTKGEAMSPPSRWSGLKYCNVSKDVTGIAVSTLAVEWIEIDISEKVGQSIAVSTLAVEWIEILKTAHYALEGWVSTLAVEWIEILTATRDYTTITVSTLAVEWIEILEYVDKLMRNVSPPSRWSGLKSFRV